MTRRAAERRGLWGEEVAAWWLRLHGWRVMDRRVRHPLGEIDLIVRRAPILAFVEVKTRSKKADLDDAVDAYRLRRVAAAAHALAPRYLRAGEDIRIDVMLIAPFAFPKHLINIWHG